MYQLYFSLNGGLQPIIIGSYNLLKWQSEKLKKESQYNRGKFIINKIYKNDVNFKKREN